MEENHTPLILFDGICNLCQGSVQFIIKRDKKKYFSFTSLQGKTGQWLLTKHNLPQNEFNSFLLLENNRLYKESTAALRVAKHLDGLWPLLYAFIIIPPFIRNNIYKWIAGNRYKWFGKTEFCMLPTPDVKHRFLP